MSLHPADVRVGTVLPELALPAITRTTLVLFVPGSGNLNPIHFDSDYARAAGMDDVFAQGMLSMGYLGRLLTQWVDQRALRRFSVRFVAITALYARPTCRGRVTALHTVDGEQRADIELSVVLDDGTVTLTGEATVTLTAG